MQRSEARRQIRAATVDSEGILDEIVGSDAEERDIVHQGMDRQRRGRRLHHHRTHEWKLVTVLDSSRIKLGSRFVEEVSRLPHLVERDDEGKHDADITMHRARNSARSCVLNKLGLVRHILMARQPRNGFRVRRIPSNRSLFASDIEGANYHWPSSKRFDGRGGRPDTCSSSSGIVALPTTRNSVRIRPTPSAPL